MIRKTAWYIKTVGDHSHAARIEFLVATAWKYVSFVVSTRLGLPPEEALLRVLAHPEYLQ